LPRVCTRYDWPGVLRLRSFIFAWTFLNSFSLMSASWAFSTTIQVKITPPDRVKLQNKTGGNLAAASVVELGDFLLAEEVNGYLWLEGDTPGDLDGVHVILRRAVPNDDFGEAQIIGTVVARVNVNDSDHKYAEVMVSQAALNSTDDVTPFRILHALGTGSQDCVVLIDRTKPAEVARYIEGTLNANMGHTTPGVTEATVARYWGGTAPPGVVISSLRSTRSRCTKSRWWSMWKVLPANCSSTCSQSS
jgi:hypothetical protein